LAAIHSVLSRALGRKGGVFTEYDFHLDEEGQPTDSPPISITITFSEGAPDEWPRPRFSNWEMW
jgi:putative ATP-dependent endonuclease of OLD family